jgi:competence protein CoiA
MKFSIVNDQRHEAQPGLEGRCPACHQPMVAKCGDVRIWHWSHKGKRRCDPWWENETEWHRAWKGEFPESWQEVVHRADSGEKHIADVKTDLGWVIEFQHSYLNPEERRSRDEFYPKLIWVVNGLRRKRDPVQFLSALRTGKIVGPNHRARIHFVEECAILRDWAATRAPVFLDFGPGPALWWIVSGSLAGSVDVMPFQRSELVDALRGGATQKAREFEELINGVRTPTSSAIPKSSVPVETPVIRPSPAIPRYPMFLGRRRWRL